jgi:hypothetical protein
MPTLTDVLGYATLGNKYPAAKEVTESGTLKDALALGYTGAPDISSGIGVHGLFGDSTREPTAQELMAYQSGQLQRREAEAMTKSREAIATKGQFLSTPEALEMLRQQSISAVNEAKAKVLYYDALSKGAQAENSPEYLELKRQGLLARNAYQNALTLHQQFQNDIESDPEYQAYQRDLLIGQVDYARQNARRLRNENEATEDLAAEQRTPEGKAFKKRQQVQKILQSSMKVIELDPRVISARAAANAISLQVKAKQAANATISPDEFTHLAKTQQILDYNRAIAAGELLQKQGIKDIDPFETGQMLDDLYYNMYNSDLGSQLGAISDNPQDQGPRLSDEPVNNPRYTPMFQK